MRKLERDLLAWYLKEAGGDVPTAAALSGLDESTFYKKIRQHGLRRKKRRPGRKPAAPKKGRRDPSSSTISD